MRFFVTVFFVSRTRCLSNILCYLVQGVYATVYAIFVSGTGWLCHISCYLLSETTRSGILDTPYTGIAGMVLHINESSQWGKSKSSLLSKSFVLSQFSLSAWRCRSRYWVYLLKNNTTHVKIKRHGLALTKNSPLQRKLNRYLNTHLLIL